MAAKRIFIISSYAMFGRGLESLLHQKDEIEIVGQEKKVTRAVEKITELKPDIVILDSDGPPYDTIPTILGHILKEKLTAKVIGLSLKNNRLHLYAATQWNVNGVDDLMRAIVQDMSLIRRKNL